MYSRMTSKTVHYFRLLIAGIGIFFVYSVQAQGSNLHVVADSVSDIGALRTEFGNHKKIPATFEAPILQALSFFPELKNIRIDFILRKGYAPLSARPTFGGIFRSAKKRKYKVFISSSINGEWDKFTLKNMAFVPSVGILGHELSHVKNFAKMSGLGLVGLGINHMSKKYMNRFEFLTDSLCISQGMGEYLLASAIYARTIFNAPDPEQLDVKGEKGNYSERYMSPATIRRYMEDVKK